MRKEISDLVASVASAKAATVAEVANSAALKAKLDAAIAGQMAPDEVAALTKATTDVMAMTQTLADSTAINAPGN